jgi:hypothetical protein
LVALGWGGIAYTVPVPIVVLVVVAIACMIYAMRARKVPDAPRAIPTLPPSLSLDEHTVLRALAVADGKTLREESVATIA